MENYSSEIVTGIANIIRPGQEFEVRILGGSRGVASGYFDSPEAAAEAIAPRDGTGSGVYITINPIKPGLMARASNRIVDRAKSTTTDADVVSRAYLPIDVDAVRPSGISSTDEEHAAALTCAEKIIEELRIAGWPDPLYISSGNGAHLYYQIDLPNDEESRELVKRALNALDFRFSTSKAVVDTTTFNAARIMRLPGTIASKGDNLPDRPHRRSEIISSPTEKIIVSKDLLSQLAAMAPDISNRKRDRTSVVISESSANLRRRFENAGLTIQNEGPWQNKGTKFVFKVCPFNPEHTNGSAFAIHFDDGGIIVKCHHASCQGKGLADVPGLKMLIPAVAQSEQPAETIADQIIGLANDAFLFHDSTGQAMARIPVEDHYENVRIKSRDFKLWATRLYYKNTGRSPASDSVNQAIATLEAIALFDGKEINCRLRVAEHSGNILYDLGDSVWRAVEISAVGFRIIYNPPTLFARRQSTGSQVVPVSPGDISKLNRYLRFVSDDDRLLFVVCLISYLIPGIPHCIMILAGQKGSSKSTTARVARRIVDPSTHPLLSMANSIQDLALQLSNNHVAAFDNLDNLSNQKSDLLCIKSTGGTVTKRTLYTDSDETHLELNGGVILNGINIVATQPDLLDRSIVLELARIPEEEAIEEAAFWDSFTADLPEIMGGVFSALSCALRQYPEVQLSQLSRMADFTRWGYAIAEAIGYGGEAFLAAYRRNQARINTEVIESHPVAVAIEGLMSTRQKWTGTVTELLTALRQIAVIKGINTTNKLWPEAPNALSRRLNEIESNLRCQGITFGIRGWSDGKHITITRATRSRSNSSSGLLVPDGDLSRELFGEPS